jgi:hypothetical protein
VSQSTRRDVKGNRSRSRKITRAEEKRRRKRNLTKPKKITPGENEKDQGFSKDFRS